MAVIWAGRTALRSQYSSLNDSIDIRNFSTKLLNGIILKPLKTSTEFNEQIK